MKQCNGYVIIYNKNNIDTMPYTITSEPKGFYRKFSGEICGMEILNSNFELQLDPKFKKANYVINDFTEIDSHTVENAHTRSYAETDDIISKSKGNFKIAIVVNSNSLIKLANDYRDKLKNQFFECELFKCVDDARIWTSID